MNKYYLNVTFCSEQVPGINNNQELTPTIRCQNIGVLIKLLTDSIQVLTAKEKAEKTDYSKVNEVLDMIGKYMNDAPQTLQKNDVFEKLVALKEYINKAKEDTKPSLRTSLEEPENRSLKTKVIFKYQLPSINEPSCKEIFLKLIQIAYNAYLEIAKHPLCKETFSLPSDLKKYLVTYPEPKNNANTANDNDITNHIPINLKIILSDLLHLKDTVPNNEDVHRNLTNLLQSLYKPGNVAQNPQILEDILNNVDMTLPENVLNIITDGIDADAPYNNSELLPMKGNFLVNLEHAKNLSDQLSGSDENDIEINVLGTNNGSFDLDKPTLEEDTVKEFYLKPEDVHRIVPQLHNHNDFKRPDGLDLNPSQVLEELKEILQQNMVPSSDPKIQNGGFHTFLDRNLKGPDDKKYNTNLFKLPNYQANIFKPESNDLVVAHEIPDFQNEISNPTQPQTQNLEAPAQNHNVWVINGKPYQIFTPNQYEIAGKDPVFNQQQQKLYQNPESLNLNQPNDVYKLLQNILKPNSTQASEIPNGSTKQYLQYYHQPNANNLVGAPNSEKDIPLAFKYVLNIPDNFKYEQHLGPLSQKEQDPVKVNVLNNPLYVHPTSNLTHPNGHQSKIPNLNQILSPNSNSPTILGNLEGDITILRPNANSYLNNQVGSSNNLDLNSLIQILKQNTQSPNHFVATPNNGKLNENSGKAPEFLNVANLFKLNSVPNKGDLIELTYVLKRPTPLIYQPYYYIKYLQPYTTFLSTLVELIIKNPFLRNQPTRLYQNLILKSNISDLSPELKKYKNDEIVKLFYNNGALVDAKLVSNDSLIKDLSLNPQQDNITDVNNNHTVLRSLVNNEITNDSKIDAVMPHFFKLDQESFQVRPNVGASNSNSIGNNAKIYGNENTNPIVMSAMNEGNENREIRSYNMQVPMLNINEDRT